MAHTKAARILLADDHAILRAGLRLLIEREPGIVVVGEAGNGEEALNQAQTLQPDLILLDLNMPDMDGLTALPRLQTAAPGCRILILTMHDDASYLREALQAGAAGYVLKKAVDDELLLAIQAVLRGETYVHSAMTQKLLQNVMPEAAAVEAPPDGDNNPWQDLSDREFEVLRRVALGFTNQEIAEEMYISVKTVETYRARGMDKLALETRAQLVRSALQHHILD